MTSNTSNTTADLLDKLDNIECLLAEIAVAVENAAAACDELLEAIPLALKDSTNMAAHMLSAHVSGMACLCAQAENTVTDLQGSISEPIF